MIILEVIDAVAGVFEREKTEKAWKSALRLQGRLGKNLVMMLSLIMCLQVLAAAKKYLANFADEESVVTRVVVLHGVHESSVDVLE